MKNRRGKLAINVSYLAAFMKERKFKPCLIKQLLNMFKLRCEWGFIYLNEAIVMWLSLLKACLE